MTASKDHILSQLRKQSVPASELPDLQQAELTQQWITYPDLSEQFTELLASIKGLCLRVKNVEEVNQRLAELPVYQESKQICSLIPNCGQPNVNVNEITDPHDFNDVDFAILPGEFCVAENGATWISNDGGPTRTLYFLAQHIALIVPASEVVPHMHAAYERLTFENPSFGTFMAGPSKTADIEQSLVIGAHGARSLTVFLVDDAF
ncbi:LUD domain-containing protein [uncultured Gimesia sp.]|uniref:LutC/YkgG family protein n=1 Tax=uncultured Gimesia sp. TaxID=1678688 RepID=UPI00262C340C|nr:LUD domain-containing protein [uncultured Gimesia sp.]